MWSITQTDGSSAIDSSIFTEGDYTQDPKTIDIYSEVIGQAGTYNIRATVSYVNFSAVTSYLDFTIVLQDDCDTNVAVTPPATISDLSYTVGGA